MVQAHRSKPGMAVPFRLDNSLGPNRADVLLVMTSFTIELAGQFTVMVSELDFYIAEVEITGAAFGFQLVDEFPLRITGLRVERDRAVESRATPLLPDLNDSGQVLVNTTVPIQIRMNVHFRSIVEPLSFKTLFNVSGTIGRGSINLVGRFTFHIDKYNEQQMETRAGTCDAILNASSLLHCEIVPEEEANRIALSFVERQALLSANGNFTIGLDGLDVRVLDLALSASPLHFPGLLNTEKIRVDLDFSKAPVPVAFGLGVTGEEAEDDADERGQRSCYSVEANIPARLSTQLTFLHFAPQPFEAALQLRLKGSVGLEVLLYLDLSEEVEVSIGDGQVTLNVEAHLVATSTAQAAIFPGNDPRRSLYAALKAAPAPPFGRDLSPLVKALRDLDSTARLLAVGALERLGDTSVLPLLQEALEDSNAVVRLAAAQALGRLKSSTQASQAAALLIRFQRDSDDRVRLAALQALAQIQGSEWSEAVRLALHDRQELFRCQAALLISQYGGPASAWLLVDALADSSPFVQLCAGLGLLAKNNEQAVEAIIRLVLENPDVSIQVIGSIILGRTTQAKARSALLSKLEYCKDVFVRQAILYALAKQGGV